MWGSPWFCVDAPSCSSGRACCRFAAEAPPARNASRSAASARRNHVAETCFFGTERRPVRSAEPCSARERSAIPPPPCQAELSKCWKICVSTSLKKFIFFSWFPYDYVRDRVQFEEANNLTSNFWEPPKSSSHSLFAPPGTWRPFVRGIPILPVLSPRSLCRLSDSRFTMRTVLISCFSRPCINPAGTRGENEISDVRQAWMYYAAERATYRRICCPRFVCNYRSATMHPRSKEAAAAAGYIPEQDLACHSTRFRYACSCRRRNRLAFKKTNRHLDLSELSYSYANCYSPLFIQMDVNHLC